MTRTAAFIAAALAAPALAQSVSVSLTHDDPDGLIQVGESVTWTLWIEFEGFQSGAITSGMNAAIVASDPTLVSSTGMTYTVDHNGGTNGGDSDGAGGIEFVNFTNSLFLEIFGPSADHRNPLPVGTFITTALNPGLLDYSLIKGSAESSFVRIDLTAFIWEDFEIEEVAIHSDSLTIVPAPASALLLAPAGLLAVRRRR